MVDDAIDSAVLLGEGVAFIVAALFAGLVLSYVRPRERIGTVRVASPRFLEPCDFGIAVHQLAREAKLLLGFEQPRNGWLGRRRS